MKIFGLSTTVGKPPGDLTNSQVIDFNTVTCKLFEAFKDNREVCCKGLDIIGLKEFYGGGLVFARIRDWLAYHQAINIQKTKDEKGKPKRVITPTSLGWKLYNEGETLEVTVNTKKIKVGVGKKYPSCTKLWEQLEPIADEQVTKNTWENWPYDFNRYFAENLAHLYVEDAQKEARKWLNAKLEVAPKRKKHNRNIISNKSDPKQAKLF